MEQITNLLYWLSTGLMVPVILLLLFFFARALLMLGGFYSLYVSRSKVNSRLNQDLETKSVHDILNHIKDYSSQNSLLYKTLIRVEHHQHKQLMLDKIIGDFDISTDKELGRSKTLVKIGPMLGLMGTLIPMGPSLVGLATGDIAAMASNMQVAFATTVVGIIIGAIGFVTLQLRQRWGADDRNILEFIVDSLHQPTPTTII